MTTSELKDQSLKVRPERQKRPERNHGSGQKIAKLCTRNEECQGAHYDS